MPTRTTKTISTPTNGGSRKKPTNGGSGGGGQHYHSDNDDSDDEDVTQTSRNNNNNNTATQPPPPPQDDTPSKYRAKGLRGNLTRERKDRDPLFYFEIVSVLGVGSMGSVAKVRKRANVIGGSARTDLVDYYKQQQRQEACFELPLVGGFFRYCLKDLLKTHERGVFADNHGREDEGTHSKKKKRQGSTASKDSSNTSGHSIADSSVIQNEGAVTEDFNDPEYQLARGAGVDSKGGYERAMKSIHLSRVTDPTFVEELKNEIAILKRLDHPHIVKAIETFEHRNQIFIVMELCSGGDLYSRDPYTEADAARIVTSIVSAISYMHSKNICHRDLKYENILFVNTSPKAEVKLIDFGLSLKYNSDNQELTEGVGTIYTMAPEVLKGSYTKQADLWSIGVIAFMLMSSQMPFYGRKRRHIVEQIMKGRYEFKGRRWKRISEQAKAFIRDLLVVDPDERADAEMALSASWLNRRFAATIRNANEEELDKANQSILQYSKYAKIKKIALMICAHKSTTTEIGILRKVFQKYDTERNGQLSYAEFKAALSDAGYTEEEYRTIFDAVDLDGTGKIRYTEFLASTIEAQGAISEERLAEAFDRIDSDDSGYISKANLRELLGHEFPQTEIDAMIDEADLKGDGRISYSEFLALWEEKNEEERYRSLQEVAQLGVSSGRSTDSDESDWEDGTQDPVSRANFIESKRSSERKQIEAAKLEAAKQVPGSDNNDGGNGSSSSDKGKHVLFSDTAETIPTVIYDENKQKLVEEEKGQKIPVKQASL